MDVQTGNIDDPASAVPSPVKFIRAEITAYEKEYKPWLDRCKGILERYRDIRPEPVNQTFVLRKYNILWANVETLKPTLYARIPQIAVERRFKDQDPVGKLASEIAQRLGNYIVQTSEADEIFKQCVLDVLLPGRGQAWVSYEAEGEDKPIMEDYTDENGQSGRRPKMKVADGKSTDEPETEFEKIKETCRPIYINWHDFGHTPCRYWSEVKTVWRATYLNKQELDDRFGKELADQIPLDRKLKDTKEHTDNIVPQATIYECWHKPSGQVYWLHKEVETVLDQSPPPVELEGFWPCPKPLYASLTNDTLIPIPDFIFYQDQANELDIVTNRIARLTDALKAAGVYDSSQPKLERILQPNGSPDNILIPVETWAAFKEKGGLAGAIELIPLDGVVAALQQLYTARDQIINIIFQVTGISDIIRGASDPRETLGAQQLKGQYGSVRIRDRQAEVANFCRDIGRLIIECGVQMFEPELISEMVQADAFCPLTPQESQIRQLAKTPQGQALMQDRKMPPPQSFMEALKMLRDDKMRSFHIDIETDSTIALNEDTDKANRVEFVTAIGQFMAQAGPMIMQEPLVAPFLGETLQYLAKGYRAGRPLEGAIDQLVQAIQQKAQMAMQQGPPPNPKMIEAQASAQEAQSRAQAHQTDAQTNAADVSRMAKKDQMEAMNKAHETEVNAKIKAADVVAKHVNPVLGAHMAIQAANPPPPPRPVVIPLHPGMGPPAPGAQPVQGPLPPQPIAR